MQNLDFQQFQNEFVAKFGQADFDIINSFIDTKLEDTDSCIETHGDWSCDLSIEKVGTLDYNYFFEFTKDNDSQDTVCISFESGISNGTQMTDYSLDGKSDISSNRSANVFSHIEINWHRYTPDGNPDSVDILLRKKLYNFLENNKEEIEKIIRDEQYDKYQTGGGTLKTEQFYKERYQSFESKGFYWTRVFEEIEVDRTFI